MPVGAHKCALSTLLLVAAAAQDVSISVTWARQIGVSKTETTCQAVNNPFMARDAPFHDQIWQRLTELNAEHVRFQPWFTYPRMVVAELEPPSGNKLCGFRSSNTGAIPLVLDCTGHGTIATVDAVVYGQGNGFCGNFTNGTCFAQNGVSVVEAACLGKESCTVYSSDEFFGGNPCAGAPSGTPNNTLAVQVTCSDPTAQHTYWNFTLMDEVFEDFMAAMGHYDNGTSGSSCVVVNFSTPPEWLYDTANIRIGYPDDWHQASWTYEKGKSAHLRGNTTVAFGEYYGRLVSWYTEGGFTDEYGQFQASGHHYRIPAWEVLNEVENEHDTHADEYTGLYDSIVTSMKAMAPTGTEGMEFVAGALAHDDQSFWSYFLNMSNHASPDIPIDWISFHYYGGQYVQNRTDITEYVQFFAGADNLTADVALTVAIRDVMAPDVKIDMDEMGVILPADNDPDFNSTDPNFDPLYWNAAAGMFAYEFACLSQLGVDVIGMSQLVGYPSLAPYPQAAQGFLDPQYPSVTMIHWSNASGTPRYWLLKLLIDEFDPGMAIIDTTSTNSSSGAAPGVCGGLPGAQGPSSWPVHAQAFVALDGTRKVLVINKDYQPHSAGLAGAAGATMQTVDQASGFGPARVETLPADVVPLAPFAVAVVTMPAAVPLQA